MNLFAFAEIRENIPMMRNTGRCLSTTSDYYGASSRMPHQSAYEIDAILFSPA